MDVNGYIELDAKTVFDACNLYLKDREIRQEKSRNEFIKKEMSKRFFPAKTEEQAEKRAYKGVWGFCDYDIGGGYSEDMVKSIRDQSMLALKQGGKIMLSNVVIRSIYKFIK